MKDAKKKLNEKKFLQWEELSDGRRRYWYEVGGKFGYKSRYIKEVNSNEETLKFYQEIYDENGVLVEIHEKYPINKGHKKLGGDKNGRN